MSPDTCHSSHLQNQNEFRVRRQQVQVYIILNEKFTIKFRSHSGNTSRVHNNHTKRNDSQSLSLQAPLANDGEWVQT